MTATTSYGTWVTRVDAYSLTVEDTVAKAFGSEGPDGFNFDAIVADYRAAINDALPPGVSLNGDEFYGPYNAPASTFDGYPTDQDGRLDIAAIINGEDGAGGIDLWGIIRRHEIS